MRWALVAVVWVAGCTHAVNDALDDAAYNCDTTSRDCADGSTCLVDRCVPHGSSALGDQCSDTKQCSEGLVCGSVSFLCESPCSLAFSAGESCDADSYCAPGFSLPSHSYQPMCVVTECNDPSDCPTNEVCVAMTAYANACLAGCSLSFDSSGVATTSCGALGGGVCQPVGPPGVLQMVCVDVSASPLRRAFGSSCRLVDSLCQDGGGCVDGVCRRYCVVGGASSCMAGESCCQRTDPGGNPIFAYCAASCS